MSKDFGSDDRGAEPDTTLALVTELFVRAREALEALGVGRDIVATALERSKSAPAEPVSGRVMRNVWGLSGLLTEWSRAPGYLDRDGQPRILKLRGKPPSFEALVSRFLPGLAISDVIEYAKKSTEIEVLPKNRVALLGSLLVNTATAQETLLAHAVRHVDSLLATLAHNAALPTQNRSSMGYMERRVVGVIRKDKFPELMALLRPQIYDVLLQMDGAVEQRAPKDQSETDASAAVAIGLYVALDADWERTGVDPTSAISPK